jgi:MFS transporter, SHS family, lactate transporter
VLRALFGIAMGGEWGIGSALVMESVPPATRGLVSGILQQGYAVGYLFAAVVYYALFDLIGWRGMFAVGVIPALLVVYVRSFVEESPVWASAPREKGAAWDAIASHWPLFLYVVLLMTAFNFFSHGTQDLFPTFLQVQHKFSTQEVGVIAIVANIGAIVGGTFFGAFSERIGRRRAIILAALLSLPVIPLWAFSSSPLYIAAGAFLIQIMVQGAWGVVPVHLNELSPDAVRGTFPGFAYQLGNLLASANASIQAAIAKSHGGDYGLALAIVAAIVAVALALLAALGKEAKGVAFGRRSSKTPMAHPG